MQDAYEDPRSGVVVPQDPIRTARAYEVVLQSLGFPEACIFKKHALYVHGLVPGFPERLQSAEHREMIRRR